MPPKGVRFGPAAAIEIVREDAAAGVVFGSTGKQSPYLLKLQELVKAGPGARQSLYAQARKAGIRILFGEKDGVLFVKLAGLGTAESFVLEFLGGGARSLDEINAALLKAGHGDASSRQILNSLSEHGKARLIDTGGQKKWKAA